jgi:hypothetical protein
MATPHKKTNNGKSAKHQESFGISEEQLELIITAVKKSMNNGSARHATHTEKNVDLSGYATKYDLLQVENSITKEMHVMENRLNDKITSQFRWLVGSFVGVMITFFGTFIAALPYIIKLLPHL